MSTVITYKIDDRVLRTKVDRRDPTIFDAKGCAVKDYYDRYGEFPYTREDIKIVNIEKWV